MQPTRIGIVGCGAISGIYCENLSKYPQTQIVAVADLIKEKAEAKAKEFNVPHVLPTQELINHPDVDIVLNITWPKAHFEVSQAALLAGKHVYSEKQLAIGQEEGNELVNLANSKNLRLGCAPDTVLGAGTQTCREFIDSGKLGQVIGAQAFMLGGGVETWHPNPTFYYQVGGGPLFDMGPYYLSSLVNLLGPIRRVAGLTQTSFPTRTVTSEPLAGTVLNVETPTHIHSLLEFESGCSAQLSTSFDVMSNPGYPNIDIFGSKGILRVPDPNTFGGEPMFRPKGSEEWEPLPLTFGYSENSRGIGLLDMAIAIAENRPHRASGALANHVLQAMHAAHTSSLSGQFITLDSGNYKPELMPKSEF